MFRPMIAGRAGYLDGILHPFGKKIFGKDILIEVLIHVLYKKIDDSISSQDKFTAQKLPDSAFMWTAPTLLVAQMAKQVFAGLGLK